MSVAFESQRSVRMEDGTSRVIPLVTEAVGLLDIGYRDFGDRRVMSFSLHGMWSCIKSRKDFSSWCEDRMRRFLEGTDFIRRADGLDVFVDVGHARAVLPAMSMAPHCLTMDAALDAAARGIEVDKMVTEGILERGSADSAANTVAGTSPVGFDGILEVKERPVGGRMVSTVDARELHARLGIRDHFTSWLDGKQAQLRLQSGVDYVEDRFLSEGMSRAARQCFLTEHAARGIVALDGRKEARAMRERLFGRAEVSDRDTEVEPADEAVASVDPVDFEAEAAGRRHGKLDDVSAVGGAAQVDPPRGGIGPSPEQFSRSGKGDEMAVSGGVKVGSAVAIREFQFEGHGLRTIVKDSGNEFVAVDACNMLGHSNSRMALKRLEPSEKGVAVLYTPGGKQQMATVTESGLYALILTSRRPEARRFRVWLTSEVLPAIARTGGYGAAAQQQPQIEGLVEPRFFAAPGWEARTSPMRMCEFLRSIGVPDEAVEVEAPVRERELRLASLGTGRVSRFFRLGTDAWVFHRSVLDAWWAAAGRDVVASILLRQQT